MVRCSPNTVENVVQNAENPQLASWEARGTARRRGDKGIKGQMTYLSRAREETRYVSKCNMACLLTGNAGFYPLYPLNRRRQRGVAA